MTDRKKVLILDDELIIAMALADDLEDEGFEIVGPFNTLEKAVAAVDEQEPDGALLDVNLGRGRTSFDLAEKLENRGVPFAFVTGYSETNSIAAEFSNAPVLGKPVRPDEVADAMRRMLRGDG